METLLITPLILNKFEEEKNYINFDSILYLYDKYGTIYHINYINSIIHDYESLEGIDDYLYNHEPRKMKKLKKATSEN